MNFEINSFYKERNEIYKPHSTKSVAFIMGRITSFLLFFGTTLFCTAYFLPAFTIVLSSIIITILSLIEFFIVLLSIRQDKNHENIIIPLLEKIDDFPLYTIVVPIFMEKKSDILILRKNLAKIKYPNIEIIYLLEEIDINAKKYFANLPLHNYERFIVVPRIFPFTKPKACNWALEFARGKYIVVYDVEDKPHPYQLHFAHYFFSQNKNVACIQFPLEFKQKHAIQQQWQRIDYVRWYNCMLNAFIKANAPIPLGGTSNHFITKELRMLGGWDSYNVTEDAELGIRMFCLNYKVEYCNMFATMEESVYNIANLYNQRVRWAKGHLITAIQHAGAIFKKGNFLAFLQVIYFLCSKWLIFIFSILLMIFGIFNFKLFENHFLKMVTCVNIIIFLTIPLQILLIKKLRNTKMLSAIFTYNIFYLFYFIVMAKALVECIKKPFSWYKTIR